MILGLFDLSVSFVLVLVDVYFAGKSLNVMPANCVLLLDLLVNEGFLWFSICSLGDGFKFQPHFISVLLLA